MRKTFIGAAATAAAALTLSLAGPASAERYGIDDPAESGHGVDLLAASVVNGQRNLRIVLTHTNLRRDPRTGAGGTVYIDTDRSDRGPELVFVGGFFAGTDYQLLATEGFGVRNWQQPVRGSYELRLDYIREQSRMRISRRALGGADEVRVAVRVSGQRRDGSQVVDWLGRPRSFTPWLARG